MATIELTKALIDNPPPLPPGVRYVEFCDTKQPGLVLREMASGYKSFCIRFRLPNGRQITKTMFPAGKMVLSKARRLAKKYISEYIDGKTPLSKKPPRHVGGLTLGDLYQQYQSELARHYTTDRGRETAQNNLRAFEDFFTRRVDSLTVAEVEAWRLEQMKASTIRGKTAPGPGLSASSLNKFTASLMVMLNWAVKQPKIAVTVNPLRGIEHLTEAKPSVGRALTDDEWKRLLKVVQARHDYWYPAIVLADETGLRKGAVFGLVWGDIDLATGDIRLREEVMKVKGRGVEHAAMSQYLKQVLTDWKERAKNTASNAPLFGVKAMPNKTWCRIKAAAGITNFRWHDYRHDFASRAVSNGISDRAVAEMLHQSTTELVQRYGHLRPDSALRYTEAISRGPKTDIVLMTALCTKKDAPEITDAP